MKESAWCQWVEQLSINFKLWGRGATLMLHDITAKDIKKLPAI